MIYVCPKCYQKVEGKKEFCIADENEYIRLNPHNNLKDELCWPPPYDLITGRRRPIRGLEA